MPVLSCLVGACLANRRHYTFLCLPLGRYNGGREMASRNAAAAITAQAAWTGLLSDISLLADWLGASSLLLPEMLESLIEPVIFPSPPCQQLLAADVI